MAEHKAVKVDPKELQKAQDFWHNFMIGTKYATIATAIILILLALAFVKFT
tara:strand:- start:8683 stop:8835 length:153 start_codon:yes stop_codon:yes gene_type:complete